MSEDSVHKLLFDGNLRSHSDDEIDVPGTPLFEDRDGTPEIFLGPYEEYYEAVEDRENKWNLKGESTNPKEITKKKTTSKSKRKSQKNNKKNSHDNHKNIQENPTNTTVEIYRPLSIQGEGKDREGLCRFCKKWFKLKTSSYWYHMNYKHGINKNSEKVPTAYETRCINNALQAHCDLCDEWIDINTKNKNASFGWRRHYQKHHSK